MTDSPVQALLFDVFGTVVDWRTSVARELETFFAPRGVNRDWTRVARDWRALYQPSMEAVRSGRREFVVLDALHAENLGRVLADHGVEAPDDAGLDRLVRAWHRLDPWPDSVEGLRLLGRERPVATLSNGNVALMVALARHAGLRWDAVLGAELARNYKPEPEVYLRSVAALGLEPGACLMVAAHNDDLRAARALGLRTAFVARPTEHGPDQATDLRAEEDWDLVADSLVELARALGPAPGLTPGARPER